MPAQAEDSRDAGKQDAGKQGAPFLRTALPATTARHLIPP